MLSSEHPDNNYRGCPLTPSQTSLSEFWEDIGVGDCRKQRGGAVGLAKLLTDAEA